MNVTPLTSLRKLNACNPPPHVRVHNPLRQALLRSEFVEGDIITVTLRPDGAGLALARSGSVPPTPKAAAKKAAAEAAAAKAEAAKAEAGANGHVANGGSH